MIISHRFIIAALALLLLIAASSCANLQSLYSEQAYRQAVSLKVESLEMLDNATEAYTTHEKEVRLLQTKLQKAYQYALGRPNNEISARQWEILIDPDRNLLGGFIERWKQQGSISVTFINENKGLISDSFDTIIQLESGKIKPSDLE